MFKVEGAGVELEDLGPGRKMGREIYNQGGAGRRQAQPVFVFRRAGEGSWGRGGSQAPALPYLPNGTYYRAQRPQDPGAQRWNTNGALLEHAQGLNFLNKKSILKGRRQITKAKFQGVLNSIMKGDYFSAFKLFIDAALEAPIYIMVYAFVRTVRGQFKDTPQPQETHGNNRLGFK